MCEPSRAARLGNQRYLTQTTCAELLDVVKNTVYRWELKEGSRNVS
jgi:hypothetical protein